MPQIKSAEKRLRQNPKRREINRFHLKRMRTEIKKLLAKVKEGDLEGAKQQLKVAVKFIERSASKGVIHKNEASRRVSRISRLVAQLEKQPKL